MLALKLHNFKRLINKSYKNVNKKHATLFSQ